MKNTQSLIVSSLKQETLSSVVISFEVPSNLKNQYIFKAGQYLTLTSNINGEKVKIKTEDDIELLSWYHNKNSKDYKTILFLHGNAGTLENRIYKINHFKDVNVNFLIIAWRGFSGNKGKPSEKGLYEDAKSAIKWLKNKGIKEENIIIYGESLGTGVAAEIAQNKNFAGVILESPS